MELKVGDKVRWIGNSIRSIGSRGEIIDLPRKGEYYVEWDDGAGYDCSAVSLLKEFQPGDRVVYQGKQDGLRGLLGTVKLVEHGNPYDFIVQLDGFKNNALGTRYSDNIFAHAPSTSPIPIPPSVPTIPAIPPPPPVPRIQEKRWGRCYRCGRDDAEMNDNGIRLCEHCENR